ncbi:hypothetical protein NCHU2750_33120 [Neorhizobium sp. NCHU2750]|nr:hypothetical protein NCHU2750_33120 [Neorhizobium sp. NCHU2750]
MTTHTQISTQFFLVHHWRLYHMDGGVTCLIEAPDHATAKRKAAELSPDWTTDLRVEWVPYHDVNEARELVEFLAQRKPSRPLPPMDDDIY